MSRYIDADELIKKIYPIGMGDGKYAINAKAVKSAIYKTPTADVVPKSEYDAVVSAVDNSTKEFLKLHDAYQNAKAEVAREIFEEIERLLELYTVNTPIHMPFSYIDILFVHYVAELKKKYTKENKENENQN